MLHLGQLVPSLGDMLMAVHPADGATADHDSLVLAQAAERLEDANAREALLHMAAHMQAGFVVTSPDELVSPRVAGQMLGVSRQLVDRMIRDNQLPATTKPGSRHKLVRVADVAALDEERRRRNKAVDELVNDMLEDGEEY